MTMSNKPNTVYTDNKNKKTNAQHIKQYIPILTNELNVILVLYIKILYTEDV